jgi:hypothetical protein
MPLSPTPAARYPARRLTSAFSIETSLAVNRFPGCGAQRCESISLMSAAQERALIFLLIEFATRSSRPAVCKEHADEFGE